jgi:hypothetical protein
MVNDEFSAVASSYFERLKSGVYADIVWTEAIGVEGEKLAGRQIFA